MRIKLLSNEDESDGLSRVTYSRRIFFQLSLGRLPSLRVEIVIKRLQISRISVVSKSVLPCAYLRVFQNHLTHADSYVYVNAICRYNFDVKKLGRFFVTATTPTLLGTATAKTHILVTFMHPALNQLQNIRWRLLSEHLVMLTKQTLHLTKHAALLSCKKLMHMPAAKGNFSTQDSRVVPHRSTD